MCVTWGNIRGSVGERERLSHLPARGGQPPAERCEALGALEDAADSYAEQRVIATPVLVCLVGEPQRGHVDELLEGLLERRLGGAHAPVERAEQPIHVRAALVVGPVPPGGGRGGGLSLPTSRCGREGERRLLRSELDPQPVEVLFGLVGEKCKVPAALAVGA